MGARAMCTRSFPAGVVELFGNAGEDEGTYLITVCPALQTRGTAVATIDVPRYEGLIQMFADGKLPMRFHRCALGGSSSKMNGAGLGKRIDKHDTIIRVNRIPTSKYKKDFGSRTDILFSGAVSEAHPRFSKKGFQYKKMGGGHETCSFKAGKDKKRCPFEALVMKGSDYPEVKKRWEQQYPVEEKGWQPSSSVFPVGYQSDATNSLAFAMCKKRPTGGFQAFLLFATICDSLSLYGFSGGLTADKHAMSSLHDLSDEHALYKRIADGDNFGDDAEMKPFGGLLQRLQQRRSKIKIVSTKLGK